MNYNSVNVLSLQDIHDLIELSGVDKDVIFSAIVELTKMSGDILDGKFSNEREAACDASDRFKEFLGKLATWKANRYGDRLFPVALSVSFRIFSQR
jgi:hypothetical protein